MLTRVMRWDFQDVSLRWLCCLSQKAGLIPAVQDGFTPLMQAADRNHAAVVKELLTQGANINQTNNVRKCIIFGEIPLYSCSGSSIFIPN